MIDRCKITPVLGSHLRMLHLHVRWLHVILMRIRHLLWRGAGCNAIWPAIETCTVDRCLVDHGVVDVGVVYHGAVHIYHCCVVGERSTMPSSTNKP